MLEAQARVTDQIDDTKVNDGATGKRKGLFSVSVGGGGYRCELSIRPFMSLALCHSWEVKLQLGLQDSLDSANFIELVAQKPNFKPNTSNYTIDLHIYAEADQIFATKKLPISFVAQDSYSFTSSKADGPIS